MQKNKILAVYPDLCDHGYISDAFMDSANEVVCVTCIIEAVKCLVEYTFIMVLVDSKMVANGNDSITTTLKTITDVPILIVNAVIYKKTPHPAEHQPHHGHAHLTLAHADHSGELHYHRILHFGELIIDPNRREVLLSGHSLLLTKIEFDILYFLARHKGRVMSRDQIYANVWTHDSSFDIDELVKAHIKRLRKKFFSSRHEYIQNVRGIGYKFCD